MRKAISEVRKAGSDVSGIDIVADRQPMLLLSGLVNGSAGQPVAPATGFITPIVANIAFTTITTISVTGGTLTASPAAPIRTDASGRFCFGRFIEMNSFVRRRFPNFDPRLNRELYPELPSPRTKRFLEIILKCGPVQMAEPISRLLLGWHLRRKIREASVTGDCDVVIEPQRLKLHLHSHKQRVLRQTGN